MVDANVSNGGDLSLYHQEVNGGQLVTMSLGPGTVDPDVTSECHLCCPPLPKTEWERAALQSYCPWRTLAPRLVTYKHIYICIYTYINVNINVYIHIYT